VLDKLKSAGLTIRPSKCKLGAREIVCLGHIIGSGKLKPDLRKISAMKELNGLVKSGLINIGEVTKTSLSF
jgi:hypothetical protein